MTPERKYSLVRREHWLVRSENIRTLRRIAAAVLVATLVAQLFVPVHGLAAVEGTFGFAALYGFTSCVAMVVFAKILGWWLQRPEDYYPAESQFLWTASAEPAPEWRDAEAAADADV